MICTYCLSEQPYNTVVCSKCGSPLTRGELSSGIILNNRFEVIEIIKKGGRGTLYKTNDQQNSSVCALKEMRDDFIDDSERIDAIARFKRESEILLKEVKHPNIPKVRDFFVERGRYYLVMDFVEGKDFESIPLPLEEKAAIEFALEASKIIEYLHDRNIIHRDIKPENFMIEEKYGRLYLVDFGTAILFTSNKTRTSIGTLGYASPEHYTGKVDKRSDIYSLGATLHKVLTGVDPSSRPPFSYETVKSANPKISEAFSSIIEKALQYKPEDRYQSIQDIEAALLKVKRGVKPQSEEKPGSQTRTKTVVVDTLKNNPPVFLGPLLNKEKDYDNTPQTTTKLFRKRDVSGIFLKMIDYLLLSLAFIAKEIIPRILKLIQIIIDGLITIFESLVSATGKLLGCLFTAVIVIAVIWVIGYVVNKIPTTSIETSPTPETSIVINSSNSTPIADITSGPSNPTPQTSNVSTTPSFIPGENAATEEYVTAWIGVEKDLNLVNKNWREFITSVSNLDKEELKTGLKEQMEYHEEIKIKAEALKDKATTDDTKKHQAAIIEAINLQFESIEANRDKFIKEGITPDDKTKLEDIIKGKEDAVKSKINEAAKILEDIKTKNNIQTDPTSEASPEFSNNSVRYDLRKPEDMLKAYYQLISEKQWNEAYALRSRHSTTSFDEFKATWITNKSISIEVFSIPKWTDTENSEVTAQVRLISNEEDGSMGVYIGSINLSFENGIWRYNGGDFNKI
jgi:serine/threonine protein kinase